MGFKVTTTGALPTRPWDQQAMREFATAAHGQLVERTFSQGLGESGQKHAAYSTRPCKIYDRSQTGRRLKAKGGVSFVWVRGPRRSSSKTGARGHDRTKIGQHAGMFYSGGYAAYKHASRKGATGIAVDLTLSGTLARSLRVGNVRRLTAIIGLQGAARQYGPHVDANRPFLGFGPADQKDLSEALNISTLGALERSNGAR
jgi:phage gpG-like protein